MVRLRKVLFDEEGSYHNGRLRCRFTVDRGIGFHYFEVPHIGGGLYHLLMARGFANKGVVICLGFACFYCCWCLWVCLYFCLRVYVYVAQLLAGKGVYVSFGFAYLPVCLYVCVWVYICVCMQLHKSACVCLCVRVCVSVSVCRRVGKRGVCRWVYFVATIQLFPFGISSGKPVTLMESHNPVYNHMIKENGESRRLCFLLLFFSVCFLLLTNCYYMYTRSFRIPMNCAFLCSFFVLVFLLLCIVRCLLQYFYF